MKDVYEKGVKEPGKLNPHDASPWLRFKQLLEGKPEKDRLKPPANISGVRG